MMEKSGFCLLIDRIYNNMVVIENRRLVLCLASTVVLAGCHLAVAHVGHKSFQDKSNPANVTADGVNYSERDFMFLSWLLKSVAIVTCISNMGVCSIKISWCLRNGLLSLSFILQVAVAFTLLISVFQVQNVLELRWFLDEQLASPPDHSSFVLYRLMASADVLMSFFAQGLYLYAINGEMGEWSAHNDKL